MLEIHKVKRIYPSLIKQEELAIGVKELSRNIIHTRKNELYKKKSFVAVSLSSIDFFENERNKNQWRLELIIDWTSQNFGGITFLVADSLYRFYNQFLLGMSADKALEKGLNDGELFINKCTEKILGSKLDVQKFQFLKWSDLIKDEKVKHYFLLYKDIYNNDNQFKKNVDDSVESFIVRKIEDFKIDVNKAREFIFLGILEELSVFTYLADLGYQGHIYSSKFLDLFLKIYENKNTKLPISIQELIPIQIKIVKK